MHINKIIPTTALSLVFSVLIPAGMASFGPDGAAWAKAANNEVADGGNNQLQRVALYYDILRGQRPSSFPPGFEHMETMPAAYPEAARRFRERTLARQRKHQAGRQYILIWNKNGISLKPAP